ncbi:MAG: methyltransferase domain-containing protein [Pyrinomonas methylaliphatogenes]|nr:methyltransferase domain-containing protein [Pyrinomonas methylaliphatogenes]
MEERLRLEFNEWARGGSAERMERGHLPVGLQALARLNVARKARCLDLGCGSGWATRWMAERASDGFAIGLDVSDEMARRARERSASFTNAFFCVANAERLPFADAFFTHAFSMEALYYCADIAAALKEVCRVLAPGARFIAVVDLFYENRATHGWTRRLNVPVHLLSSAEYRDLFARAGFVQIEDARLYDPTPLEEDYPIGWFDTREDYLSYRAEGSLMIKAMKATRWETERTSAGPKT